MLCRLSWLPRWIYLFSSGDMRKKRHNNCIITFVCWEWEAGEQGFFLNWEEIVPSLSVALIFPCASSRCFKKGYCLPVKAVGSSSPQKLLSNVRSFLQMKLSPHALPSLEDSGIWEECFLTSKTLYYIKIEDSGELSTCTINMQIILWPS